MFKILNSELKSKSIWIVIGYSFNDPVIREIFARNSDKTKRIVFVHPHAQEIRDKRLADVRNKSFSLLHKKFGEDDFRKVNYTILKQLKPNLMFTQDRLPI